MYQPPREEHNGQEPWYASSQIERRLWDPRRSLIDPPYADGINELMDWLGISEQQLRDAISRRRST